MTSPGGADARATARRDAVCTGLAQNIMRWNRRSALPFSRKYAELSGLELASGVSNLATLTQSSDWKRQIRHCRQVSPQEAASCRRWRVQMAGPPRLSNVACLLLFAGLLVTFFNVWQLRLMQQQVGRAEHIELSHPEASVVAGATAATGPVYWVRSKNADGGYLDHIYAVLERCGWRRDRDVGTHAEPAAPLQWDLLWHHDYPFLDERMRPIISQMLPHQKLNHIPGSGYYTSKVNLATSNISGIPVAFGLPENKAAFLQYAQGNPDKLWVQKNNRHRGIRILPLEQLDLSAENSFVQEYVSKPLLIDRRILHILCGPPSMTTSLFKHLLYRLHRKFDIGIYTVVTSAYPLRVYVFDQDALLRFCPAEYHPFDPSNLDKYVVGDDYKPTWTMPSLQKYFVDMRMTYKESLNAYLRSVGKDPGPMWDKIRDTIRQVFLDKAEDIQMLVKNYRQPWNFFELSRFDFVVDESMNVYLMEANMSPNLSTGHFAQNKPLYERVIYNMFALVGVARTVHGDGLKSRSTGEEEMLASDGDVMALGELCDDPKCDACSPSQHMCAACRKCLTSSWRETIRHAYLEHVYRGGFRRVLPEPLPDAGAQAVAGVEPVLGMEAALRRYPWRMSEFDAQMRWWFWGMCRRDAAWCA